MNTEFIETEKRAEAVEKMWWAEKVVKVCGGYMGFESYEDYITWKNQK